jgi:hypothetical protein
VDIPRIDDPAARNKHWRFESLIYGYISRGFSWGKPKTKTPAKAFTGIKRMKMKIAIL